MERNRGRKKETVVNAKKLEDEEKESEREWIKIESKGERKTCKETESGGKRKKIVRKLTTKKFTTK